MKNLLLNSLALLCITACGPSETDSSKEKAPNHHNHQSANIQWFDGDVSAAFAEAEKTNKPVFLYWGAVWCPPCQEIRNTVFLSQRFKELSAEFVPVYLDGDTEAAQLAGEQFGVKGYPTMIVFNPEGTELTRIPGGIDISRYNDVLSDALNMMTPTADLIANLIRGDVLEEAELKQLAFYSWGQDFGALPDEYEVEIFKRASEQSHNPVVSTRLYMQYLYEFGDRHGDEAAVVEGAEKILRQILSNPELVLANWGALAYYSTDLLPLIASETTRAELSNHWQSTVLNARHAKSLSTADQLAGFFPTLELSQADNPETALPADLIADIRKSVARADRITTNAAARQSVMNIANHLLQEAGLIEDAKNLLTAELEKSAAPYYFMSSLAAIAEKQEDIPLAIQWRKQAFDQSQGAATRLQWGASYVRALIRLTPEASEEIIVTTKQLVAEGGADSELFSGRNFRVLKSLAKALHEWRSDDLELNSMFAELQTRCDQIELSDALQNNCLEVTSPWQTQPLAEAGRG